ncbi:MAG: tetratricopeptide repeat protein [Chitinophagales bacterium]
MTCAMKLKQSSALRVAFLAALLLLSTKFSFAQIIPSTQKEKTETRTGNKEYDNQSYSDAEGSYKKALDIKNNMPEATFNLGDAVYSQKRYDDAGKQFQLSAQTNPNASVKAGAYHNLGNSFLEQKKWEDAANAYKNALKIDPNDKDTKYNLAYANAMLQQQKNQQQQNQNDKNKQDQKKDQQQNQDQKKDQQKQDQQKQQQQQQDQQQSKQQQAQKPKLSKEEAEQLLQALQNEEQKTTQKMQQKNMKAVRVKIKKDW